MEDEKRLSLIKGGIEWGLENGLSMDTVLETLSNDDIVWLISQAEKLQSIKISLNNEGDGYGS
ncbi:hypothetical protein WKH56_20060 [Priestia sp. SB1]|uniref:hypothetical protein n=1 Tax=Priestia sp. SB1 TaxID=3132359 RepID=UPI00317CBD8F